MTEELRNFTFFENWYDMAEGRDTDEKRLAFYDTIMRYAFEGKEPKKPVKGVSRGVDWAAWDAFNAIRPVLVTRLNTKSNIGRMGGLAGRGDAKARHGNRNAAKDDESENASRNASKTQAETQAENATEKRNLINKIKELFIAGSDDPAPARAKRSFREFAKESFDRFWESYPSSCPRKYDKRKCLAKWELLMRDAKDADALFRAVMEGLEKWKRSAMWNEGGGQYIKAPIVWLNGGCWEDSPKDCGGPLPMPKKPLEIKATDWQLCAERCSMWNAGKCDAGCKIPPQLRPIPLPPEECVKFKALEVQA